MRLRGDPEQRRLYRDRGLRRRWPGLLALLLWLPAAMAASTDTPRAHALIQQYGSDVGGRLIPAFRAIYKEYLREAGHAKADKVADIAYGAHELQRLDVFAPMAADAPAPVLLFVHGGGFVSGDKGDGEIYDNVLDYFAARGIMGVNINYRLAPAFQWPTGATDVREALRWVRVHAAEFGGNPSRIFLMGHSAGASHVAAYAFIESLQLDGGDDGVRGAILVSGVYTGTSADAQQVYYGDAVGPDSERLPINNIEGRKLPLFIIDAEYDFPMMQREAAALLGAVCARDGRCPRHQRVPGHNHYTEMHHFNTADDSIASAIADFMRRTP